LVIQYKEYDQNLTGELNVLLKSINEAESVEELESIKNALQNLTGYFKDYRREKAALGIHEIESIIEGLRFDIIEFTTNTLKFILKSGETEFQTSAQPKVTSNCATIQSLDSDNNHWIVEFDSKDCYVDDQNNLDLVLITGGRKIKQTVPLDITKTLVYISIKGEILIKETGINGVICTINISSDYETPFSVDQLSLEWPKHPPVFVKKINEKINGKGLHILEINLGQNKLEAWQHCQKKHLCMLSGRIWYTNLNTNVQGSYTFSNKSYTTE